MVKTDIQDYWRRSWVGNEAIPQDGSANLYSGDGEIDVMWSGTDVVYAKQRENLAKGDFYDVQDGVAVNRNNNSARFELLSVGANTHARIHISENIASGSTYTLSFDVTEVRQGGPNPIRIFIVTLNNSFITVDKVGHFSKTFTAESDRVDNIPIQMLNTSGSTAAAVGDYCIIKNVKLEKNIVDSQYSVAPSDADNRVKIGKHYYHTTQIDNLIWTTENLNEDLGGGTWEGYYDNDPTYGVKGYGKLYTWDAICKANETPSDALAAILPEGWRVPTKADFDILAGTSGLTSAKIKEKWYQTTPGINDTGFSSVAGGYRDGDGEFGTGSGLYLTSTSSNNLAYRFADSDLTRTLADPTYARSVRLVRDATSAADVTFLGGEST